MPCAGRRPSAGRRARGARSARRQRLRAGRRRRRTSRARADRRDADALGLDLRASAPGRTSRARPCRPGCRPPRWRCAGSPRRARRTPARRSAAARPPRSWSIVDRARRATTRSAAVMRPPAAERRAPRRSLRLPSRARVELVHADRREAHLVAGREHRGRRAAPVPQRHRRAAEDVPAARALQRVDGRHGGRDRHRPGRHLRARILAAGQREARRADRPCTG